MDEIQEEILEQAMITQKANEFKKELKKVFDSFGEVTGWNLIEQFSIWLSKQEKPIILTKITIYKHINETAFPAWLTPYLFTFLSESPYKNNPIVWDFFVNNGLPFINSAKTIKDRIKKEEEALQKRIKELRGKFEKLDNL